MSDSLLVALQKYSSRPSYNPLENFTTEAFTWLLRNDADSEKAFLELIKEKKQKESQQDFSFDSAAGRLRWETQVGTASGIADIVGRFDDITIVVEVKVWSGGADNQLQNYVNAFKKAGAQSVIGVYLTADYDQQKKADSCLLWEDVYTKLHQTDKDKQNWKIQEFLDFLASQGLLPCKPISIRAWRYSGEVLDMISLLDSVFGKITGNILGANNDEQTVSVCKIFKVIFATQKSNQLWWGRKGIQFKRSNKADVQWNPAFFIGLVLNSEDHCYHQLFEKGAIFSLIVDIGSAYHDKFEASHEVRSGFAASLQEAAKVNGWLFYDNRFESIRNKWHPLVVYRPMVDIACEEKDVNLDKLLESKVMELLRIFSNSRYQDVVDLFDASDEQLKEPQEPSAE